MQIQQFFAGFRANIPGKWPEHRVFRLRLYKLMKVTLTKSTLISLNDKNAKFLNGKFILTRGENMELI
jgi:hypothetical protein